MRASQQFIYQVLIPVSLLVFTIHSSDLSNRSSESKVFPELEGLEAPTPSKPVKARKYQSLHSNFLGKHISDPEAQNESSHLLKDALKPKKDQARLSLPDLELSVDNSSEAIINRLEVYVSHEYSSAIFCELQSNLAARALYIFNSVFERVIEELLQNENADMLYGLLAAFIHHRVDVTKALGFHRRSVQINSLLTSKRERLFIALHVLEKSWGIMKSYHEESQLNFFGIDGALLTLPVEEQVLMLNFLIKTFPTFIFSGKLIARLFKNTEHVGICQILIEAGFVVTKYPKLCVFRSSDCKAKRVLLRKLCGLRYHEPLLIITDIADEDYTSHPRKKGSFRFPFQNQKSVRWVVYSEAFGSQIIQNYLQLLGDGGN